MFQLSAIVELNSNTLLPQQHCFRISVCNQSGYAGFELECGKFQYLVLLGRVARGFRPSESSNHIRLKPICSASKTSWNIENWHAPSLYRANNKVTYQTARIRRLICAFVVHMHQTQASRLFKLFSCSHAQLNMKFILFINVKMPTIVGILTL